MIKKILIVQTPTNISKEFFKLIEKKLLKTRPDFACFPEYFACNKPGLKDKVLTGVKVTEFFLRLSKKVPETVFVCGTIIEKVGGKHFNTCFVVKNGKPRGKYRKVFLTKNELQKSLSAGKQFGLINCLGIRIGILVCNDVLKPEASTRMLKLKPDIVFIPLVSPKRSYDPSLEWRKHLFTLRAFELKSFVVKVGSIGRIGSEEVLGKSLASAPWGLVWKCKNERKPCFKLITLDFGLLNTYRKREPLYKY